MTHMRVRSLSDHKDWINCVAVSPDGKTLASASDDNTVRLWNSTTGKCLSVLYVGRFGLSVAFGPLRGRGIIIGAGATDNKVHLLDTNGKTHTYDDHPGWVWSVAFSPDGKLLASASDDTIRLWNSKTRTCMHVLNCTGFCKSVAFSPNGKLLASASSNTTVQLWTVETGIVCQTLYGHVESVRCVVFSATGKMLASGSFDATVRLWSLESLGCIGVLRGHNQGVRSVAFSRNGKTLASGSSDATVRIWSTETWECVEILYAACPVNSVAFSQSGKALTCGLDCSVLYIYSLLDYHVLGCASLYLQANVAPYVVLDVVDLLASDKKQRFSTTALHMHGEKISFIGDLLRKRVKR